MTDGPAFDSLPDDVRAFLINRLAESIGGAVVITFQFDERYAQPTAATHVLHVRADGSHCYYGRQFEFWG